MVFPLYTAVHAALFKIQYRREVIRLSDNTSVALDWHVPQEGGGKPLLILIPGIQGTAQYPVFKNIIRNLSSQFDCVFVWHRCKGGVPIDGNKLYCFASWRDVKDVVDTLQARDKTRELYLYALSLGACPATQYLINEGEKCPLKAACLQSAPLDSFKNSKHI